MPDENLPCAVGRRRQIGSYTFELSPLPGPRRGSRGRWGVSNGCKGMFGHRTPVGAWIALQRWLRTPTEPIPERDHLA